MITAYSSIRSHRSPFSYSKTRNLGQSQMWVHPAL